METNLRCPHCGATLPEGSVFCFKCGSKLNTEDFDLSSLQEPVTTPVEPTESDTELQDQNIPIDDLLGQTHVINSLMSELDEIVKGVGDIPPVTPSVKPVEEEKEEPVLQVNTEKEEDATSPFAWEIPAFKSSVPEEPVIEENTIETSEPVKEPALKQEFETDSRTYSRAARHRQYETDPYLNETGTTPTQDEQSVAPPIKKEEKKKKKKSFFFEDEDDDEDYDDYEEDDRYDDEDFEDEYKEHHVWPIVLGIILLIIVGGSVFLCIKKPAIINKGIDTVNTLLHTDFNHIGESDEPEETAIPTLTPEPTVDTTIYDDEYPYFSFVASAYSSFYREYIDCYNAGDISTLSHVTDDLRANITDRYTTYNTGLGFKSNFIYIDLMSYQSQMLDDGYYEITFHTYQENDCWQLSDNTAVDNNPTMSVAMHYDPITGDYYFTLMDIVSDAALSNSMVDVTEW